MGETGDFGALSVLAVEDEGFHAAILRRMLGMLRLGEVVLAENGAEALQLLEAEPERFDVLITDLVMPVMDGYKLVKAIRASNYPRLRELPILVLSGSHAEEVEVQRAKLPRINGFIQKPVKMAEIYDGLVKIKSTFGGGQGC